MVRKRIPKSPREVATQSTAPMYVTMAPDNNIMTDDGYGIVNRSFAHYADLSDLKPGISGRPGFDRSDYNQFRPGESVPTEHRAIMKTCNTVYEHNGMVKNVVDLMADFACKGVRLSHPDKTVEKFYRNWFKQVNGKERSERFLNYFYRLGNVVTRVQTAKVTLPNKKRIYRDEKSYGSPDIEVKGVPKRNREIPWRYTFLEPSTIEVFGKSLASFVGKNLYGINLSYELKNAIRNPKTPQEKELVSKLPTDVVNAAKQSRPYPLPPDKTVVYHYKKDDWDDWAKPMIYAILSDIVMLEKLKLADSAALDGAISNIRIFKLGNIEAKIKPTANAVSRLNDALSSNLGGGTIDIIWGPDIELIESKTTVHQFLGEAKYTPHLNSIFAGLGIPPTLTGSKGSSGTTNNFISLKTLIQRLQYGRDMLQDFWENECRKVQEAMGFKENCVVEFDINNLGDEISEKKLLMDLMDRNLISEEYMVNAVGANPELERLRTNREDRERASHKRREKSGPYHDSQFGIALKKIALQSGVVTPSQVGLNTEEKNRYMRMYERGEDEMTSLEMRSQPQQQEATKTGQPGRPKNSKDKEKRKTPDFKPKNKAILEVWAKGVQYAIGETLNDIILERLGKSDFRSLTSEEFASSEDIKFSVLFNVDPLGIVDEEVIAKALVMDYPVKVRGIYKEWQNALSKELERKLTVDECRHIQTCLYATIYGGEDV